MDYINWEDMHDGQVVYLEGCHTDRRRVSILGGRITLINNKRMSVNERPVNEVGPSRYTHQCVPSVADVKVVKPGDWLASLSSAERKECAIARGFFAYFPDAIAAVARHSVRANEKHNPGEPVRWSREKSFDHADCVARHSVAVAANPAVLDDGQPEIICRAWRAMAELQLWVEERVAKGESV